MRGAGAALFTVGSLSWAVAQWLLVWMFARFAGGAAAVGEYALILAIATPVFVFAQFGLRTVYLSLSVEFPWRTYLILRVAGIAGAALGLVLYFGVTSTSSPLLWAAVLLLKSADLYFDLLQARIQRGNRLGELGVLNLINSLGTVVLAGLALALFRSVSAAIIGSAIVSIAIAIAAHYCAQRHTNEHEVNESGYRPILRAALPSTLAEGLASLFSYLPILILSRIAGEARIGVFSAASYILTFANISGAIIKNVLITSFRITLKENGIRALVSRTYKYAFRIALLGGLLTPVVVFFGDPAMRMVYGSGFGMTHAELLLLMVAAIPIAPAYIFSATLSVMHLFSHQAWNWALAIVTGLLVGLVCLMLGVDPLSVALSVALGTTWSRFIGIGLLLIGAGRVRG